MEQKPTCKNTIKSLEDNTGINLCDLGLGHSFLSMPPKAQAAKGKTDKFDFIKIRNFCT